LRDLIHLFKYARIRTLDRPLGHKLSSAFPRDERFDLIVPVPMHWWRHWKRGFNQTELLARVLSRRSGIPFGRALVRSRATPPQAGLTLAQRHQNLNRAFRPSSRMEIRGKRILLVDDVFTTGSTASACAKSLKKAGAASVVLLTLARVDRRLADNPIVQNSGELVN
jgi:competence protein ComFC